MLIDWNVETGPSAAFNLQTAAEILDSFVHLVLRDPPPQDVVNPREPVVTATRLLLRDTAAWLREQGVGSELEAGAIHEGCATYRSMQLERFVANLRDVADELRRLAVKTPTACRTSSWSTSRSES